MKKVLQNHTLLSIILILVLMILAYAIWVPFLGFYREDWYVTWNGVARGASAFPSMYAGERPLMGHLYAYLYPILGNRSFLWGIYAFILRVAGVFVFGAILRQLWPNQRNMTFLATVLFAIYPGFLQQVQPNCFQMHFHGILFALLSIHWMLRSVSIEHYLKSLTYRFMAVVCAAIYPFTMEYYIGLEGMRYAMLWFFVRQQKSEKFTRKFLFESLPYLLVSGSFLYWRVFIFESDRPTLNIGRLLLTYSSNSFNSVLSMGLELFRDMIETVFLAWIVPLYNQWYYGDYQTQFVGVLMALLGAGLWGLLYYHSQKSQVHEADTQFTHDLQAALLIGFISVISTLIPVVSTLQNIRFVGRDDRFSLPASMGASLLLAVLIMICVHRKVRPWLAGVLIFSALITHSQYARYMIDFWKVQQQVWWQLSWRAPNIKRNTLLMVNLPFPFYLAEGYEIWAPANLMYYRDNPRPRITGEVISQESVAQLAWRGKNTRNYRGIYLYRDFDNPLVVSLPSLSSCLHVLDGSQVELSAIEEPLVQLAAPYSQVQRILIDETFVKLDETIFGKEPSRSSWCYFYQKASYYRQKGDWQAVIGLAEQASKQKLAPYDVYEWLPFFVAYAMTGQTIQAAELAQNIRSDPNLTASLCKNWRHSQSGNSIEDISVLIGYICIKEEKPSSQ